MNVMDVNPEFVDDILLETLLTTQVENLHAVSDFKHETFTVLQYAQDFGTIVKESIKRSSRWVAKYYTHDRSYYPIPQSAKPLSAVATMTPLPSEGITPGMEEQIKEWLESHSPVRQRTVKPGFHIVVSVVSVVSVVRKKFIGQIEFILSRTKSCMCRFFCIEHLYGRFP